MISLVMAASTGLTEVVQRLLENKADPNATLPSSAAPIVTATSAASSQMSGPSTKVIPPPSIQSDTPLVAAATGGHLDCLSLLLASGASVDLPSGRYKRTPLIAASMYGQVTCVDKLLEARANIDGVATPTNDTALTAALCGPPLPPPGPAKPVRAGMKENKDNIPLVTTEQRVTVVKRLLSAKANPNGRHYHDHLSTSWWTPLVMLAAGHAEVDVAKVLIDNGADARMAAGYGDTPLIHAAIHGHMELAKTLIAGGARGDSIPVPEEAARAAVIHGTQPPLLTASTNGQLEMIKLLLSHGSIIGIDVNQLGTRGDTSLMVAAQANHADVLETLIDCKADVTLRNQSGQTALMKSTAADCTARLISAGSDPLVIDNNGNTALTMAATEETLEMIQWLTSAKADVHHRLTSNGATALMLAAWRGDDEIVKHLSTNCGARADGLMNDGGNVLSMIAASHGGADMVTLCLELKADANVINSEGETPLTLAALCGHAPMMERLITLGKANPNHVSRIDGETALIRCTRGSCYNGVAVLLEAKANVDYVIPMSSDFDQRTSLWIAVEHKLESTVELLLAAKANANHRNARGHSLISVAIANNDAPTLLRLIQGDASLTDMIDVTPTNITTGEIVGIRSYTPLNWAVSLGHVTCVRHLLTAGASPCPLPSTSDGSTPLLWCARRGDNIIAQLLIDAITTSTGTTTSSFASTPSVDATATSTSSPSPALSTISSSSTSSRVACHQRSRNGRTPAEVATKFGHHQLAALFTLYACTIRR
jgi:ankyrin repeat protein